MQKAYMKKKGKNLKSSGCRDKRGETKYINILREKERANDDEPGRPIVVGINCRRLREASKRDGGQRRVQSNKMVKQNREARG